MILPASSLRRIRYGRLDASEEDLREAALITGLGPFLGRLEEGLDTVVGERGVQLSVGERQRRLLARAFVARPTTLVLDEATANLDFRT
jgi:ABC-type multidrug transport system fused ATPase/permease subunit